MLDGWPTNWKISIPQKFSYRSESSEPHDRLSSLVVWQQEEEPPENLALKARRVWSQELYRMGGNRNSTLGGHTEGLTCARTWGKMWWPRKGLSQTYLLVLEAGGDCGSLWGQGHWQCSSGEYSLAWALLQAAIFSPKPGPTQQPAGSTAGAPQTKQPTGWEHSPHPSVDRLLKVFLCTQLPDKHNPWQGPAHQRDKTQLHPPVGSFLPPTRKPA